MKKLILVINLLFVVGCGGVYQNQTNVASSNRIITIPLTSNRNTEDYIRLRRNFITVDIQRGFAKKGMILTVEGENKDVFRVKSDKFYIYEIHRELENVLKRLPKIGFVKIIITGKDGAVQTIDLDIVEV